MINEIPLGELCPVKGGYAFKSSDYSSEGIPLIRIGNIYEESVLLNDDTVYLPSNYKDEYKNYLVEEGDILIALSGATTGKFGIYPFKEPALLNQRVAIIKLSQTDKLNSKYIYYYLPRIRDKILYSAKGAAQPNISTTDIEKFPIPGLSIDKQNNIVSILDKANSIRQKRRETLRLADEFLRSTFLEMFGDELEKKSTVQLGEYTTRVTKGESPKWQGFKYQAKGILFVTSENVGWGKPILRNRKYIPEEFNEKLSRSRLKKNDLLINLVGASIGRACKVDERLLPGNINQAVSVVSLKEKEFHPDFVIYYLISSYGQKQLLGNIVDVARANISLTNIRELNIIKPNFNLQEKFGVIVEKTEQLKRKYEQSLQESENLFNSLMQRAFRGEL